MKKTMFAFIIVAFLVLFSYASASTGDSAFIPELLTMTYNEAIEPVFSALSLDTSTVSAIEEYYRYLFLYYHLSCYLYYYGNTAQSAKAKSRIQISIGNDNISPQQGSEGKLTQARSP